MGIKVVNKSVDMGISQKSPIQPGKHWQMKSSPKSVTSPKSIARAMQLPLLQSTTSHISIRGLGDGVEIWLLKKVAVE